MHIVLLENHADCKLRYLPYRIVSIRNKIEVLDTEYWKIVWYSYVILIAHNSVNSLNQCHVKEHSGETVKNRLTTKFDRRCILMVISRSLPFRNRWKFYQRRSHAVARSIEISQQIRIALWLDKIELTGLFIRRVDTRWQTFRFDASPLLRGTRSSTLWHPPSSRSSLRPTAVFTDGIPLNCIR